MDEIEKLSAAFQSFTQASKTLENYYDQLQERVRYLTQEVEEKNVQLEEALGRTEEAKDHLRCVLESIAEAIVVVDTSRRVTMLNASAEAMLGLSADEASGRGLADLGFELVQEGGDTVLVTPRGRRTVILSKSPVLDSAGAERGQVVLFRDISRLRELEAHQERNQRLASMGEMAAKIVHEVRSPLCSIELYASMLARDLEGSEHAKLAKGISSGISSLNTILTNMLFFARPQKPLLREVDLCQILRDSLFMLMPLIESRGIALRIEAEGCLPAQGDAELIKQVLLNILMNAIQITPSGKTIAASCLRGENSHAVSICDQGEGIDKELIEKIFDPFFSTKEKGTGLGLTIASKIMIAHGGSIGVKSEKGEGSCFLLRFPREAAQDNSPGFSEGIF